MRNKNKKGSFMTAVDREAVSVERDGGVAILTFLNRPDGTMDDLTEDGLEKALDLVEADPQIRAVVLTGAAKGVFIRHYDVATLLRRGNEMRARGLTFTVDRPVREVALHRSMRRMEASDKPYIAALNGTAMGGGFELALACDLRIAEAGDYAIGLPEINLGILPGAGGTQRLARLLGVARALEIVLLGRTVAPDEAVSLGLVHECVPDARARALELARQTASRPAAAVAAAKRLIRDFAQGPVEQGFSAERTIFCSLVTSPDALALMEAMVEGRHDIRDAPSNP
jgi:enoyl-CoA hydratase